MISFNERLHEQILNKNSHLCVGLDITPEGMGESFNSFDDLVNHSIKMIDVTIDIAVCYKPNFAFFERWGASGFKWLEQIVKHIDGKAILIADAKRGDIGNTAKQYAKSIFEHFGFDAVTLSPYMGSDSINPFIENRKNGAFILCRTSNSSAAELQDLETGNGLLYETTAKLAVKLNANNNVGLVVGATAPSEIEKIRKITPNLPMLIPGIGAQGGDLEQSMLYGNTNGDAVINVSRGINFAGDLSKPAIRETAMDYVNKMREIMNG